MPRNALANETPRKRRRVSEPPVDNMSNLTPNGVSVTLEKLEDVVKYHMPENVKSPPSSRSNGRLSLNGLVVSPREKLHRSKSVSSVSNSPDKIMSKSIKSNSKTLANTTVTVTPELNPNDEDFIPPQVSRWPSDSIILDRLNVTYEQFDGGASAVLDICGIKPLKNFSHLCAVQDLIEKWLKFDISSEVIEHEPGGSEQAFVLQEVVKRDRNVCVKATARLRPEVKAFSNELTQSYAARSLAYMRDFLDQVHTLLTDIADQKPLAEPVYRDILAAFCRMCHLYPAVGDGVKQAGVVLGQPVLSTPDLLFLKSPDSSTDEVRLSRLVVSLAEITKKIADDPSPTAEVFDGIPPSLHVRHAGELTVMRGSASGLFYVLGMAVQRTRVSFTCLRMSKTHLEKIRGDIPGPLTNSDRGTVYYSRSYDLLSAADRAQILSPMLRLSTL